MAKKSKRTTSSSSYFPLEVTGIILSKLSSVKSLLRFKAVSKSWNTMISDPVFVGNHLLSSNSPNNNLFLRMHRNADKGNFSLIKFEGRKIRVVEAVLKKPYFSNVLCECNGVILLTDYSRKYKEYVLWNPSTQWQMYFKCPYEFNRYYYVNHGICYDSVTNDFKVIVIDVKNYAIYSCNNNSWAIKKSRTVYYGISCSGIFVDGATYWLLQGYEGRQLIVYFDPKTEELKNLSKPKEVNGDGRSIHLASLRGRLCLFCNTSNTYYEYTVQIWIKDKGGFENYCWNEFITIENMWPWNNTWMIFGPLCYVGNKIVIRLRHQIFGYYCPSDKTLEYFEETDMYGCDIVPYRNSLYFPSRKGNIGPEEAMAPKLF